MSKPVQLIYVPCGSEEEAVAICSALLERSLVACGNIIASRSLYRWEGQQSDEVEHILICKTVPALADQVEAAVKELHSYTLPCILRFVPALVNDDYAAWVEQSVAAAAGHFALGETK